MSATAVPVRTAPVPARPTRGRTRSRLLGALAVVVALLWLFPVYWMVNSAFLPSRRLQSSEPSFLPTGGTLGNFRAVLADESFFAAMRTSLAVTGLTVVVAVLFGFLAALALSRFRFRGRRAFVVTVLVVQMIPAEGLFISQYRMLDQWGLVNAVLGLGIVYVAAVLPFTVWMLRGFADGVPVELEEAAMVDGLSRTGAFFRITLPLLAPGLVASGVYGFLQAWNEYTLALVVMTDPDDRTLPLWLQGLVEANKATDWGVVMAGATLIAVPVIAFFLLVQRRLSSGLVAGAVKG